MSLRFLFVDMDSYFASCEQELHPRLRGRPIAVVPTMADTTCCIAASYEAKAFGVKTGTMVRDAKRLCPGIQFVEGDHKEYVRIHHQILATVERCIPVTAVKSIDELYAELPPNWRTEGKALQVARQIRRAMAREVGQYIGCSIGIGPNVFLSKMASGMEKPRGLVVIRKEDLPDALFSLELRDIHGVGHRMEQRLKQNGIHTVRDLCNAELRSLIRLWNGVEGERMYRELRGEVLERPESVRHQVGHSHVLPPQQRNQRDAFDVLHRLTQKAAMRLRDLGFYCGKLSISVRMESRDHWERETTFFETSQTAVLLQQLRNLWSHFPEGETPQKVSMVLGNLLATSQYTPSLFTQEQDLRNEALDNTMDSLNRRFGSRTVYYAGGHAPARKIPLRIAFSHIPNLDNEQE